MSGAGGGREPNTSSKSTAMRDSPEPIMSLSAAKSASCIAAGVLGNGNSH